jgi:hypothetical protein
MKLTDVLQTIQIQIRNDVAKERKFDIIGPGMQVVDLPGIDDALQGLAIK